MEGTVKWFNAQKDSVYYHRRWKGCFVHYSSIESDGFKS